jgi:hypothetical protein
MAAVSPGLTGGMDEQQFEILRGICRLTNRG